MKVRYDVIDISTGKQFITRSIKEAIEEARFFGSDAEIRVKGRTIYQITGGNQSDNFRETAIRVRRLAKRILKTERKLRYVR